MSITKGIDAILGSVGAIIVIFVILFAAIAINCWNYKKGVKDARYYAMGFFFISIAFLIQILKSPLQPGSALDILGLIAFVFFITIGLYNIFYLTKKR